MKTLARLVVVCSIVSGAAAVSAQQPVTLTSTADFQRGNNEGLISTAQDRLTRERITAGTVGSWSASTALPSGHGFHSSVAYGGYVYTLGGFDENYSLSSDVLVAPVNGDGSMGSWSSTTALPSGRYAFSAVAYNGFLYVIGGDDGGSALSDVLVAPINADGSVGSWSSTTELPFGRDALSVFAYNGFIYAIGGYNGYEGPGLLSDVVVAPINADGSVGSWSSTTSLPVERYLLSVVAYNGFVYVIGGDDTSGPLSDVLVAQINANGAIGSWSSTTALPSGRVYHSVVVFDGFVYILGGMDATYTAPSDVLTALIDADGSLGTWSPTSALPSGRFYCSAVAYGGFVYAIGGRSGSSIVGDVLFAAVDADAGNGNQAPERLRGFYSYLVDLQGDSNTRTIILNGQTSPGGNIRLQVRLATNATKVFGSETVVSSAPLGTPISIPGTARYAWIRLTLDDTGTSAVDQPTYVTDITIAPFSPPTEGVVFDGPGVDIDTQVSTTTIEAHWAGFTPSGGDNIAFYEWAIGTSPGLTNVQGWVNVGQATSASNPSLFLGVGLTYFVRVRAISNSGLPSPTVASDGVQVEAASTGGGGGGGGGGKHCGHGASAAPGSGLALLVAFALAGSILRRRRVRA